MAEAGIIGSSPNWHVQSRGKEFRPGPLPPEFASLTRTSKENIQRRHFDEGSGWEKGWKPCIRILDGPQEPPNKGSGLRKLRPGPPRPDRATGLGRQYGPGVSGVMPIDKELGVKGKINGAGRRIAQEMSLEKTFGRKIRVVEKETMRNGLSEANPGDKGYATAEHAPEYRPPSSMEKGPRIPLAKLDRSWSVSGSDPTKDKHGRPICEHVQIFCTTPWRKLSMYVHFNARVQEILDQSGEGGDTLEVFYKGVKIDTQAHLQDVGIGAKASVHLIEKPKLPMQWEDFSVKMQRERVKIEHDDVAALNDWKPPEETQSEPEPAAKGKKK